MHKYAQRKIGFYDKIEPIISNAVATIGGKYIIPKGVDTVSSSLTGDEGQLHTKKLNDLPHFPDSLVNIVSTTSLAGFIEDDYGAWVITIRNYSILPGLLGSTKVQ